jgi:SAM-dependent methyltransferase
MQPNIQAWDKIYRKDGRVFDEPFPRFGELVGVFKESGCSHILDLGCGSGRHVVHLVKEGFRACGLDVSFTGLRLAQGWLLEEGLTAGAILADMRFPLPFRGGAFDGLLSTQVIHHARIAEIRRTIGEIWRVLAGGGVAFVSVAARQDDDTDFEEIEPGTFVPTTGTEAGLPHHIFTEDELRLEFRDFEILDVSLRAEGKVLALLAQKL